MADYIIKESYTLPSLGKVYNVAVNPEVSLRSMTTEDEMKRLSPSDKPHKLICEIIDDCLVEKPGISAYDMCLGDEQFLLHKLRIVTYGSDYKTQSTCPFCGCVTEKTINLESLAVKQYSDDLLSCLEFDLPKTGKHIKLKMQTPRMLDEVEAQKKELLKRYPHLVGEPAFLFRLMSLIESVDGVVLDPMKLEDFARTLPMMDTNYIMQKADKALKGIGLELSLDFNCSVCGLDYKGSFRTTQEFFGPSVD